MNALAPDLAIITEGSFRPRYWDAILPDSSLTPPVALNISTSSVSSTDLPALVSVDFNG